MSEEESTFEMSEPETPRRRMRRSSRDQAQADSPRGPMTVLGRDGQPLSRKRKDDGSDPFHIPQGLIPTGWTYQWCTDTVIGSKDLTADDTLKMYENGWRPVPADRHEGRFMPVGHKGNIIRGGQILMERPKELTDEATAENLAKAYQQMRDRDEALMGGKAKARQSMRGGFEMSPRNTRINVSVDPGIDAPLPSYQPPED